MIEQHLRSSLRDVMVELIELADAYRAVRYRTSRGHLHPPGDLLYGVASLDRLCEFLLAHPGLAAGSDEEDFLDSVVYVDVVLGRGATAPTDLTVLADFEEAFTIVVQLFNRLAL